MGAGARLQGESGLGFGPAGIDNSGEVCQGSFHCLSGTPIWILVGTAKILGAQTSIQIDLDISAPQQPNAPGSDYSCVSKVSYRIGLSTSMSDSLDILKVNCVYHSSYFNPDYRAIKKVDSVSSKEVELWVSAAGAGARIVPSVTIRGDAVFVYNANHIVTDSIFPPADSLQRVDSTMEPTRISRLKGYGHGDGYSFDIDRHCLTYRDDVSGTQDRGNAQAVYVGSSGWNVPPPLKRGEVLDIVGIDASGDPVTNNIYGTYYGVIFRGVSYNGVVFSLQELDMRGRSIRLIAHSAYVWVVQGTAPWTM